MGKGKARKNAQKLNTPQSKEAGPVSSDKGITNSAVKRADLPPHEPSVVDSLFWGAIQIVVFSYALALAYDIRLYAIKEYGLVIHEFDPWFNYRATEYLSDHGLKAFFEWYDYMSWYPLGRPVGTTIYPGMQITSVVIHRILNEYLGIEMSLNDVCCYVPAWFGISATVFVALLTRECTKSTNAGVFAALVMSCIPAHTMRSVGGGYDNESIAVTAMCMTFYCWVRSLRDIPSSIIFGFLGGLSYFYMVAAWGGYVFVINMIGFHAVFLLFSGRYSRRAYFGYTILFIIGTLGAIQIPVVGLTPLKSLEQIGPLGVFGMYQVFMACDIYMTLNKIPAEQTFQIRFKALTVAGFVGLIIVILLWPTGYFGPLSSRVRGLLVQHTRTGNPLVDSVAEHQPASPRAYFQYLFYTVYLAPIGYVNTYMNMGDAMMFLPLYATIAYFFSAKMVRLIILLGPIVSCLSGIALKLILEWIYNQFFGPPDPPQETSEAVMEKQRETHPLGPEFEEMRQQMSSLYYSSKGLRKWMAILLLYMLSMRAVEYHAYAHHMARAMSNPSIMFHAQLKDGTKVLVDDYREAYFWLKKNTPEDARVMAWWDYGYQITGIANRTSIADGNTWNHEHIATLGRCLVSEEKKAHSMIRHLADYVLVWTGGGGDDVAKMPHIARIANSVYSTVCGVEDPLCSKLSVDRQGNPSDFMGQTLIYKLHSGGQRPGVNVDPTLFENVFSSKFNKVRIWKVLNVDEESKSWNADPANRICDPPGSWICKGLYPPKFLPFVSEKKDFQQLEDFNRKKDESSDEYQKRYHEMMANRGRK